MNEKDTETKEKTTESLPEDYDQLVHGALEAEED